MKCSDVQASLSAFHDGDVTAGEASAIRQHLTGCAACTAIAAGLREVSSALSALERDFEPDADLWPGIATRLGGAESPALSQTRAWHRTAALEASGWQRAAARWSAWLGIGRGPRALAWRSGLVLAALAAIVVLRDRSDRIPPSGPAWEVARVAGAPILGVEDLIDTSTIAPGVWLRTDSESRARLTAPDVGRLDVGPATEVRVLQASPEEHRIELARGTMHAFIWAPPRLFFVETPAGVAEDLGCAYDLTVDRGGNGELDVTLGFVSFERDGREVIVPQGARCDLRAGLGPGTPHMSGTAPALRAALQRLDFIAPGDASALATVLETAVAPDALTLWHLLPRTSGAARTQVLDRLAGLVAPPHGVTREGVLALDATMLDTWWAAIYPDWNIWRE